MADIKQVKKLRARIQDAREFLHVDDKTLELVELDAQCALPEFWDDVDRAQKLSKRAGSLRALLEDFSRAENMLGDVETALELAVLDPDFSAEADETITSLEKLVDELEMNSWFDGRFDEGDAIVSINPGQGGLEAQDWTEILYRMLTRYCINRGWKVEVLDEVPGESIGLDRASFQVEGRLAYGMLRSENGVHRLVRISPTDAKARRQTTFASVEVLPVLPDDIEVELNESDVRVDVYRSSGPGGQCVNTTDSAVRLTHIPTGIVVTCQNQKSQLQNKEAAFRVLRARLYEQERRKREEQVDEIRGDRMDNSWGSQIRSYVLYPYQMVKDLRTNVETSQVDDVLDGNLDPFVIAYHKWRVSQ